jgi:hypothetical protein
MQNIKDIKAFRNLNEHKTFGKYKLFINDPEVGDADFNTYTKVVNARKEKYKNEPWISLLKPTCLNKYILAFVIFILNQHKPDEMFYVHRNKCRALMNMGIRDINLYMQRFEKEGLVKFQKKDWPAGHMKIVTPTGLFKGLRNFYTITDELIRFVNAYEDVYKIEFDMGAVGLPDLKAYSKDPGSIRAMKRLLIDDLKTYHGAKLKKKLSISQDEREAFNLPESQEVFEENKKHDGENINYFIESDNLRITSDLCNTKKGPNRDKYLSKIFGAENGKPKCYEFDRVSSIYTLEYDLNHDVKEASSFDFYQFLEFSVLQKIKNDELDLDIEDFEKFKNAKFSYGELRAAFKILPMPLFMRGNMVAFTSTKLTIIDEQIHNVLERNENKYVKNCSSKVQYSVNVHNKHSKYKVNDHDYVLYSAAVQILDSYGLAHTNKNFSWLLSSTLYSIQHNLGHDKRKKHIFFFESLVMSFAKYYLHKTGVEKVALLYDAMFVPDDVPRTLVSECMTRAISRVKEIINKYMHDNYKNRKKRPKEFEMQNLEEDEMISEYKEFIKDKEITKTNILEFDDYIYDNYFKVHNSSVGSYEEKVKSTLTFLGYDVA